jgi:methyl coenzyme M reductase alpha subunit
MSRSVTHVLAYLMRAEGMSLLDALHFVQEKRPLASPNSGFMRALAELELELHHETSIDMEAYRNDRFCSTDELRWTPQSTATATSSATSTATATAAAALSSSARCASTRHRTAHKRGFFDYDEEDESSGCDSTLSLTSSEDSN